MAATAYAAASSSDTPSATILLKRYDNVIHLQCYGSVSSDDQMKAECCRAMRRCLLQYLHEIDLRELMEANEASECHRNILNLRYWWENQDEDYTTPLAVWTLGLARTKPSAKDAPSLLKDESNQHGWSRFVWNDGDSTDILSVQSINGVNLSIDNSLKSKEDENADAGIRIESMLAGEGGWHRDLTTRILWNTITTSDGIKAFPSLLQVVLLLPSGLFINIEDAVRVLTPDVKISVDTAPGVVIDQEEPAFTSPEHAVVLNLTFPQAKDDRALEHTIEFETHLHLRYPMPLLVDTDAGYSEVILVPPMIFSAFHGDQRLWTPKISMVPQQPPLHILVPTAPAVDFIPAFALSVLLAVLGAIAMLRDMSRIN